MKRSLTVGVIASVARAWQSIVAAPVIARKRCAIAVIARRNDEAIQYYRNLFG